VISLKKIYKVFLVLIIFLSIIDVTCTYFYVNLFGLIAEANPIVIFFIQKFGLIGGLGCSFLITLISVIFFLIVERRATKIVHFGIITILIAKIIIVVMHLCWIIQIY
jgi:hypothetical protein